MFQCGGNRERGVRVVIIGVKPRVLSGGCDRLGVEAGVGWIISPIPVMLRNAEASCTPN